MVSPKLVLAKLLRKIKLIEIRSITSVAYDRNGEDLGNVVALEHANITRLKFSLSIERRRSALLSGPADTVQRANRRCTNLSDGILRAC